MITDGRQTLCYRLIVIITLNQSRILNPKKYYHEKAYNLFMPVYRNRGDGSRTS